MSLDFDRSGPLPACDLDAFEGLTGAERDDVFMQTERQIRSLMALQAARIHRVSRCGSYMDDGHRTVKNWHQAVTNASGSTSTRQVLIARMMADLPMIAEAAAAGDLGPDQLRVLSNLYANPRARDQLPGYWEGELVNYARTRVLPDFEKICRRWETNADPDGAQQKHEIARSNRCAKRSVVGAGSEITVKGDALSGDICWDVIQAHAEAEYLTDVEERAAKYGDDARNHPLARTHAQRMHDAFVAVCLKAKATSESCRAEPLTVIHTTTEAAIAALLEFFGFDPAEYLATAERLGKSKRLLFAETAAGAPVDRRTLAAALLCGQVQRIVTDPKGHTINLGRRSRLFTGATRDAVLLNEDRCSKCHVRHKGIQIDHLRSWEDLGLTDQDNAGPNCPRCNREKHRLKISVMRDETGWHFYRADGTEIAPRTRPPD